MKRGSGAWMERYSGACDRQAASESATGDGATLRYACQRPLSALEVIVMLKALFTAVALTLFASASVQAAPCRDAQGKFVKCDTTKAKAARCKDAQGKFAKCGMPGAKPVD